MTLARDLWRRRLLLSTCYRIPAEIQRDIIDFTLKHAQYTPPERPDVDDFWVTQGLTKMVDVEVSSLDPFQRGWWHYYSRLDDDKKWEWLDLPIVPVVKDVLAPLERLYSRFTRVTVILQIPGRDIPAHRDLIPGDEYSRLADPRYTATGDQTMIFRGMDFFSSKKADFPKDRHRRQWYLNLKVPLSQKADDPGKPFILHGGRKIHYSSGNKLFFLNEAEIYHGADPVDFYRGVLFVDGIFDLEKWTDFAGEEISILETRPIDLSRDLIP